MKEKTILKQIALFIALASLCTACGGNNRENTSATPGEPQETEKTEKTEKNTTLTINVPANQLDDYKTAFEKYFEAVVLIDGTKHPGFYAHGSRYVIEVKDNIEGLNDNEPIAGLFLILLHDSNKNVYVNIVYTVGPKESDATIVKADVGSDMVTYTESLNIVPDKTLSKVERLEDVASKIKSSLKSIDK